MRAEVVSVSVEVGKTFWKLVCVCAEVAKAFWQVVPVRADVGNKIYSTHRYLSFYSTVQTTVCAWGDLRERGTVKSTVPPAGGGGEG